MRVTPSGPSEAVAHPAENAQDDQRDDALAVGRALEHVVAAPVQADRIDEVGDVKAGGEIGLGVQAAAWRAAC